MRKMRNIYVILSVLFAIAVLFMFETSAIAAGGFADAAVAESGVKGGVIVHLGCGDGAATAKMKISDSVVVQGLDADRAKIKTARQAVLKKGLYGDISFSHLDGEKLPYADEMANLLIVEDAGKVARQEMMRRKRKTRVCFICCFPQKYPGAPGTETRW